jgi:DNA invertase Pin-like site-specific DNA recombinase
VNNLVEMNLGLQSLNDPVDTTSSHGRLIFNIFTSLAEFEHDIIRERTQAGLSAARSRGIMGGRPKGSSKKAEAKTYAVSLFAVSWCENRGLYS